MWRRADAPWLLGVAAGLPAVAVFGLIAAGVVPGWAGGVLLAALGVCGAVLAWLWRREMGLLAAAWPGASGPEALPLNGDLLRRVRLRQRGLLERLAQAERQGAADRAILETLGYPLLILSAGLQLHRANAAAARDFGREAPALLRHPVLRDALARVLAGGGAEVVELTLPVPVPRDLRATVSLIEPGSAEERLAVLLTERTREAAIERMRVDFIANAGHELRTPLSSLVGFIATLRGPAADDPPAQQRFLGIMAEQAARMQRLIDDLLSLSGIELSEHQCPMGRVDLAELARQEADAFEPAVLARRAALDLALEDGLPAVKGDADQLAQVVRNLLDNALKYGGEGVWLRLGAARQGGGVLLTVADGGPGIAAQHVPRLTERFYRVDKGRSRATGGTGLGLAIVKHVVNRHRGVLRIESEEGRGTRVHVWLPAA